MRHVRVCAHLVRNYHLQRERLRRPFTSQGVLDDLKDRLRQEAVFDELQAELARVRSHLSEQEHRIGREQYLRIMNVIERIEKKGKEKRKRKGL